MPPGVPAETLKRRAAELLEANPPPRESPVTGGQAPGCTCDPAWPSLVVHAVTGDVAVEPAATPGGLACLYQAGITAG